MQVFIQFNSTVKDGLGALAASNGGGGRGLI